MPDFLPRRDVDLLGWSRVFSDGVTAQAEALNVPPDVVAALAQAQLDFAAAMSLTTDPSTRTRPAIAAKDEQRAEMIRLIRGVSNLVRGQDAIAAPAKLNLGLKVRDGRRTPIAPPRDAPLVHVDEVQGKTVTLRLRDRAAIDRRAKPRGVCQAHLSYCVSPSEPGPGTHWIYYRAFGRTTIRLTLPSTIPAGSRVWFSAAWTNPRGQLSPWSSATDAWVGFGLGLPNQPIRRAAA